jgi:hypothetical protein
MINAVQTMNHTSLAILYDTLGIALPVWDERVMNVNIVLMPGNIFTVIRVIIYSRNSRNQSILMYIK